MNPQALPPYPRDPVSKLASWDYPIGNIERWHAKTSLDQHYAAGKLQPTEYETRMVGIMGATMWSHLVVIFADLPAPGPAYDGKQLLKACQTAQRAQPTSPSVTILFPILLCLIFLILLSVAGPLGIMLSIAISIFALCIVISMATVNKYQHVYQNFSNQLNLQQRALLDEAASQQYAQYYWSQQQGQYQQQLLQLQQQQQIQNMFNNINRQY
ncbi:DUF1707 SHOCT-like domain-containing protein [Corynebacterium matruchotii]|uniref:DUF1707 SHOCT-like domain-containing protein n=1 Tax=Corynebacterium matruchotii TaxID=43768 RepID=UPI00242B9182|nr:DUF1707 domain-containing protein [Corynebacterium matruchotii]